MNRWHCKLCSAWGLGGPAGWETHRAFAHRDGNRYGAMLSFGFAPNYANGWRTSYRYDYRPAPRCQGNGYQGKENP